MSLLILGQNTQDSTFHQRIALGILSEGPITLHLVEGLVLTLGQREAFLCQVCTFFFNLI